MKINIHTVSIVTFAMILSVVVLYFSQDLQKHYYFTQLGFLNLSLKKAVENSHPSQKALIIRNALPMLNLAKMRFLRYKGYWPDIYNGYNQAAFIEKLNNDMKSAVRLLLVSLHYHPNMTETYRALAAYLKEAGFAEGASRCWNYHNSIMKGIKTDESDRNACIETAEGFVNG